MKLSEQYRYNPFDHKWYKNYLKKSNKTAQKFSLINYKNSLKKYYIIFIRENYSKKDINDIFNCIKKVDYFFKKKL